MQNGPRTSLTVQCTKNELAWFQMTAFCLNSCKNLNKWPKILLVLLTFYRKECNASSEIILSDFDTVNSSVCFSWQLQHWPVSPRGVCSSAFHKSNILTSSAHLSPVRFLWCFVLRQPTVLTSTPRISNAVFRVYDKGYNVQVASNLSRCKSQ